MTDVIKRTLLRPMSIDIYARWLSRVILAVAIIMIGWGLSVVLRKPATGWFAASAMIWMALLLLSALWLRGSFTAIAAARWPPPSFRACSAFCV
jgi:hypothetical protein